jgi:phage shock protein PspC (stress-responsive transcriptional regulator)
LAKNLGCGLGQKALFLAENGEKPDFREIGTVRAEGDCKSGGMFVRPGNGVQSMEAQQSLFARSDTLFGICEALGQDFGFNPNYLRVALAAAVIWSPAAAMGGYAAAGAVVLLSRLIFPAPRSAQADAEMDAQGDVTTPAMLPAPRARAEAVDAEMLPIAA